MAKTPRTRALDQLNDALAEAQTRMYHCNFGVRASVPLPMSEPAPLLWWDRHQSSWGFVVEEYLRAPKPLQEATVEIKKLAALLLPALYAALVEAASLDGRQIQVAIEAARAFDPNPP